MSPRKRAVQSSRAEQLLSELAELSGDIPADLSPADVGRRALRRAVVATGAAGALARVVDSFGAIIDVHEGGSRPGLLDARSEAIGRGEEVWLSTARAIDLRFPAVAAEGARALALVPLDAAGGSAGVLGLSFDEERSFPKTERSFLRALGRILLQQVDEATLHTRQRQADCDREKRVMWAEALCDAYRLIESPASLDSILDDLARVSCEIPADYSAIRVLSDDGKSLQFRGLHHRNPAQGKVLRTALAGRSMPADLWRTAHVLENGKSLLLPEVEMGELLRTYAGTPFGEYVARFPLCTVMAVALRSRGRVIGVVMVARVNPVPFRDVDLRFLEEVADRAAVALDSAELLQKLASSEEQLRLALDAGRLGAWDWDIPSQRVTWSTMVERIHGIAPGSFEGTFEAYQRDIYTEDRDRLLSTISRAVEDRSEYHVCYRIIRPDGEVRWLEAHGTMLCDRAGNPQRLVGVCVDITERKNADERLRATMQALRDEDQRKDQFLAMLAHELRNPLSPILNATYMLGKRGIGEDAAARARTILERQVRHMVHLLDDLLDVSRITRGKIELVRETMDMIQLVREVVGDHLESFRAAGLTLDLTASAEPLFVHADRTRLAQVIANLLSNALKFSDRGKSVRVHIDCDASGQRVVLAVRDEGLGIDAGLLARMFEPFVQADASLAHSRGGLGLGLAVVKGLVALHGGSVSASSGGTGKGAELRVELARQAPPRDVSDSCGRVAEPTERFSAKILVVEDNADAAESLRVILSGAGYRVWVESTGQRATELVKSIRPDVVLCDLGVPDKDGFAIASDIRSDRELCDLPLIAITGYGTFEDRNRSRQAGFDLHLTKPVSPGLLLSELSRRLARAS